jgi:hypothetical protein
VAALLLALVLAAVPARSPAELPWSVRLLFDVPAAVGAVGAALVAGRRRRDVRQLSLDAGLAAAVAAGLFGAGGAVALSTAPGMTLTATLGRVPSQAALAMTLVAATTALLVLSRSALRSGVRRLFLAALLFPLLGGVVVIPAPAAHAATDPGVVQPCTPGDEDRDYAVAAATVDLPFNRWGRRLENARIFVLEQDLAATVNWSRPLSDDDPAANRRLRPRPLVLRANEGECVKVTLTNRLSATGSHGLPDDPRVGIEANGMIVDVRGGGARVGNNPDHTVGIGEETTYYWRVPDQEGLFLFQDLATPAGAEHDGGSRGLGLHGAVAVEPAGSVWTDPRSGAVLSTPTPYQRVGTQSGELYVEADIHPPGAPSFRESVQLAQDEIPGIGMGFNFGSEPMEDREQRNCPDCLGEETWLSSWPYGDPALIKLASGPGPWLPGNGSDASGRKEKEDCGLPESCYVSNVFHTYTGDPTKIRFGLAGVKETHVFHLHAHQWLADPRDAASTGKGPGWKPESTTIDSQSFGPGEAYTADLLFGSGSRNGTFGDSIFHCHLYPHFAEGFWSLLRTHDVALDGRSATPDGVNVRPLVPLPGRADPPRATAGNPGYPGMIPGTYGWRAPQPPGSITEGGVDGTPVRPAPRLVAGRGIEAAKLGVERAVMARRNGGKTAPRGAPYADPCPAGARELDYAVTVLQRDLVYNEAGHHDPQARIMVLTKDVSAILDGRKKAEPLFIRANAGDCINFALTNMAPNWVGGDAFQTVQQTNMAGGHIHLVKFDVTSSDGGSNGWNYQQAAFTREQAALTRRQAAKEVTCEAGEEHYGGESTGCRLADRTQWTAPEDSTGLWGQTIHERWFADYELRTVFTHDHHFAALVQNHGHFGALIVEPAGFDVRDPTTGRFRQPVNDPRHGKACGARCTGTASGESVDVVGPGANDDYREYGLAVADFVPLVKKGGDPSRREDVVGAPPAPEAFPRQDPGTMAINYRNAPLVLRGSRAGKPVDPAHRFSSWVFGDPRTPLLQAYARDNVKLRVIQGSQEEQHLFAVHGMRWREEPDDPGSPLVAAQTIGISEAFNAEVTGFDCKRTDTPCRGDHLYGGTSLDDLWNGMWGILRVHGTPAPGLRALPDNTPAGVAAAAPRPASRQSPPTAKSTGTTCPAGAPVKAYDVVAMSAAVTYNEHGDSDPEGLLYVLAEDEQAVRTGTTKPEPLVLRANAGDCVKISLRNALPVSYGDHVNGTDGDVPLLLEPSSGTPMGTRVSLHPQLLRHDVRLSDGAAVGFNPDSTAGIGQTVRYEWYADTELGATNLTDHGDVRGHRHHGLFAGLVIEPRYATYHDPATGAEVRSGPVADVRVPGRDDFRELTLLYQDGMDLRDSSGGAIADRADPVPDAVPDGPADGAPDVVPDAPGGDGEDAGEKGVNYTNAPLHRRLGAPPGADATAASSRDWADVFSSAAHGDPRTPMLRTHPGDPLRVRVLHGGAKSRQLGFALQGASWHQEPYDERSEVVGVQGGIGPGKAVNVHTRLSSVGDHLWSSPTSGSLPQGIWGLVRVQPASAGGALVPLERTLATVTVFDDTDGDGVRGTGEQAAGGTEVRLRSTTGTLVDQTVTGSDGRALLSPPRGAYDVEVTGAEPRRIDLRADSARVALAVGLVETRAVTTVVYEDRNGDGTRDGGEAGLPGWSVSLTGGRPGDGAVPPVVTAGDGGATFPAVPGAGWKAAARPRSGWRAPAATPVVGDSVTIGVTRRDGVLVRAVDEGTDAPIEGLLVESGSAQATTDADGAVLDVADGSVRLRRPGSGLPWQCARAVVTTPAGTNTARCDAQGAVPVPAGASAVVVHGTFGEGIVGAALYEDADSDGRRDAGETPLADWPVALVAPDGSEVARTTTDSAGQASLVAVPGRYDVVPLPPVSPVAWTATTGAARAVDVRRAKAVDVASGWAQRGSVSVGIFHDRDRDGVRDPGDDPLAERTVRLLDAVGRVTATAVSDGAGRTAFAVRAGATYFVEAPVPLDWQPTAPGAGLTRVRVTAPATVEFGEYNTVDQLAPAAPTVSPGGGAVSPGGGAVSPGGGAVTGPVDVTMVAETGATIRYTLDGTIPTAARGMVYGGPVRVSVDRVLRAVAVDRAGNISDVTAVSFDLPWRGRTVVVEPSSWLTGLGLARDGQTIGSVLSGGRRKVDTSATAVLPAGIRSPAALTLSLTLRSTLRRTPVQVQWFDAPTGTWRTVATAEVGLDAARLDLDVANPPRAVAPDGSTRFRVVAGHARPFDLSVTDVLVTAVNT